MVLLIIFSVKLRWFPGGAVAPPGSNFFIVVYHLILPAIPLMFVLFGYISRHARAGTMSVLESPYVRAAYLKGLPPRRVITHHVLRNALPATVTVVFLQIAFMITGLTVIEVLFTYPGLGKLTLDAANRHDVPLLQACALLVGVIIMGLNLLADIVHAFMDPRIRLGGRGVSVLKTRARPAAERESVVRAAVEAKQFVRAEKRRRWRFVLRRLCRRPVFLICFVILVFWVIAALFWRWMVPHDPYLVSSVNVLGGPSAVNWLGTDELGRDVLSRVLAGASTVLTIAPAAVALSMGLGTFTGLAAAYYRGLIDDMLMRTVDVLIAVPALLVAVMVLSALGSSVTVLIFVIAILYAP